MYSLLPCADNGRLLAPELLWSSRIMCLIVSFLAGLHERRSILKGGWSPNAGRVTETSPSSIAAAVDQCPALLKAQR
jgi:hypothetical protein